jgi:hypothetical protein
MEFKSSWEHEDTTSPAINILGTPEESLGLSTAVFDVQASINVGDTEITPKALETEDNLNSAISPSLMNFDCVPVNIEGLAHNSNGLACEISHPREATHGARDALVAPIVIKNISFSTAEKPVNDAAPMTKEMRIMKVYFQRKYKENLPQGQGMVSSGILPLSPGGSTLPLESADATGAASKAMDLPEDGVPLPTPSIQYSSANVAAAPVTPSELSWTL